MISAIEETESVVRCIELGADDYLSKPFDPTLLRARVHATLEKKRLRDAVRYSCQRNSRSGTSDPGAPRAMSSWRSSTVWANSRASFHPRWWRQYLTAAARTCSGLTGAK